VPVVVSVAVVGGHQTGVSLVHIPVTVVIEPVAHLNGPRMNRCFRVQAIIAGQRLTSRGNTLEGITGSGYIGADGSVAIFIAVVLLVLADTTLVDSTSAVVVHTVADFHGPRGYGSSIIVAVPLEYGRVQALRLAETLHGSPIQGKAITIIVVVILRAVQCVQLVGQTVAVVIVGGQAIFLRPGVNLGIPIVTIHSRVLPASRRHALERSALSRWDLREETVLVQVAVVRQDGTHSRVRLAIAVVIDAVAGFRRAGVNADVAIIAISGNGSRKRPGGLATALRRGLV